MPGTCCGISRPRPSRLFQSSAPPRGRGSRATLIALTGYGQDSDKQKARESGFDHHLVKPVSVADIEALLAEIEIKAQ